MAKKFFNPFPKYLQIREILVRRFGDEFAPADRLPAEHELCAEFGVSRETVRDALRGLEESGIIRRERGKGTFLVRLPDRVEQGRFTGLVENFTEFGLDTEARVLSAGPAYPPGDVAKLLGEPSDEEMFRIVRVRYLDGEPLAIHDAFLPLSIGPDVARLDLTHTTLFEEISSYLDTELREHHQHIDATVADAAKAATLGVAVGAPLLVIRRLFGHGPDHQPFFFESHFRSDRYFFTVQLAQDRTMRMKAKDRVDSRSRNEDKRDNKRLNPDC